MKIETGAQARFNSLSIHVTTPAGDMFVLIMENEAGSPCGIQLNIGKTGGELGAWSQALARLCSRILDLGGTINDLIEELSNHTTDKSTSRNGVMIRSGVDGLCFALMEYQRDRYGRQIRLLDTTPRLGG